MGSSCASTDMLLKADVVLEQRSLMRWLLDPVLKRKE